MTDNVHRHLPQDLRDTEVVEVRVIRHGLVWVRHRDGTCATHIFQPEEFHDDFISLRDPVVFATAAVIDGTLAWDLGDELVYDVAADGLWLHARGFCDGSHDLSAVVIRDGGVIGLEWAEPAAGTEPEESS
ncbi:hypothetical protein [Mycobacterium sp. 155]|uniref:hypothetical protein n=1 Tax=Mycobacterium sp. 155 TaxID=1157943 RepID=UPI000360DFC6|nr:hypothetical protein [Mycobacterium sp. 155]